MTPNAELVHQLFRGSSEIAKFLRFAAVILDVIAAIVASLGIWGYISTKSGWMPLLTLGIASLAIVLRVFASSVRSFGLRCRRTALRAFANNVDISPITASDIDESAPFFAMRIAKWLPAQLLESYYEPTRPPGSERMRELYAHSAYYTRRLLKRHSWICGILAALVLAGGITSLYALAMQQTTPTTIRESVIATTCSFVFMLIFARLLQLTISCAKTSVTMRRMEDEFFKKPSTDKLSELVEGYEIERAAGPDVPTLLYYFGRNRLQQKWHERRKHL